MGGGKGGRGWGVEKGVGEGVVGEDRVGEDGWVCGVRVSWGLVWGRMCGGEFEWGGGVGKGMGGGERLGENGWKGLEEWKGRREVEWEREGWRSKESWS